MDRQHSAERIEIGADVIGGDGNKLGSVAYVVVHPPELHLTDLVVSTGSILGRDIVVPVDVVDRIAAGKVYLSVDQREFSAFEDYVDIQYKQPPDDWIPVSGSVYPTQGTLWPGDLYYPQVSEVHVNAPAGTVGLNEGMEVESSDGHKVGSIVALDTDPSSGDVTGIVIHHGLLFRHDTRIPVEDIADVGTEHVALKLTRDEVHRREKAGPS
jgi:uncharacterized protein YrrD